MHKPPPQTQTLAAMKLASGIKTHSIFAADSPGKFNRELPEDPEEQRRKAMRQQKYAPPQQANNTSGSSLGYQVSNKPQRSLLSSQY